MEQILVTCQCHWKRKWLDFFCPQHHTSTWSFSIFISCSLSDSIAARQYWPHVGSFVNTSVLVFVWVSGALVHSFGVIIPGEHDERFTDRSDTRGKWYDWITDDVFQLWWTMIFLLGVCCVLPCKPCRELPVHGLLRRCHPSFGRDIGWTIIYRLPSNICRLIAHNIQAQRKWISSTREWARLCQDPSPFSDLPSWSGH